MTAAVSIPGEKLGIYFRFSIYGWFDLLKPIRAVISSLFASSISGVPYSCMVGSTTGAQSASS